MVIEVWDVYYLFTTHTTPPKNKYVAIVCAEPEILGFIINSEINQFVAKRPKLMPCMVELLHGQNTYLKRDSFLDCQEAKYFVEPQLHDYRGGVAHEARPAIVNAVKACPVLRQYDKVRILAAIAP